MSDETGADKLVRLVKKTNPFEFEEIPATELPDGCTEIVRQPFGKCFVPRDLLGEFKTTGISRHGPFPEEIGAILPRFVRLFADVHPKTLDGWEAGFRQVTRPWSEIATWQWYADALEKFTSHITGTDTNSKQKRKDVYSVVLSWANDRFAAATIESIKKKKAKLRANGSVSSSRVLEIGEWMYSPENRDLQNKRRKEYRELIAPDGAFGPDRVSIDSLFDGNEPNASANFDPKDLVESSEVIIAVDVDTRNERPVYGRALYEAIRAGKEEASHDRVLRVEIDEESDHLEKLAALVSIVKGSHDLE